jgi:hypothetical protein
MGFHATMIRLALPTLLLLAACSAEDEESVEEKFERTEAAILNTAEALEAETENAVQTTEAQLENQADALSDSLEAPDPTAQNQTQVNETR